MKTILCYGDSNTWGAVPGTLTRHPVDVRWTGVLANALGADYRIIDDGINGRSTVWDDPGNMCRNGLAGLGYSLYRAKPLDLVILMLGTNDLNYTDADGYYEGISMLAKRILRANEHYPGTSDVFPGEVKLLLVSPIELHPDAPKYAESRKFAALTEQLAQQLQIPWMDAAAYAKPSPVDLCHMDAQSHLNLGKAIAEKVKTML